MVNGCRAAAWSNRRRLKGIKTPPSVTAWRDRGSGRTRNLFAVVRNTFSLALIARSSPSWASIVGQTAASSTSTAIPSPGRHPIRYFAIRFFVIIGWSSNSHSAAIVESEAFLAMKPLVGFGDVQNQSAAGMSVTVPFGQFYFRSQCFFSQLNMLKLG